jgi:glycine betaine/proline transport system ATP-binding protein
VREFVQGISRLKLVRAHTIMEPLTDASPPVPVDAIRVPGVFDLDALIDISIGSDHPLVVQDDGRDVGIVTKTTLLRGIQGGGHP